MSVGDSGGVRSFGGAGGGGIAIGDPVTGGTATYVLFVDANGDLGQHSSLTFDPAEGALIVFPNDDNIGALIKATNTASGGAEIAAEASDANDSASLYAGGSASLTLAINSGFLARLQVASDVATFRAAASDVWTADGTTFEVVDVLKINNAVTAGIGVASTHRIQIVDGATTYYLLATTVA